jgi:nanoRNase/pAp phosphatase (c-di-AMP/oligoRNAs hydrolase)
MSKADQTKDKLRKLKSLLLDKTTLLIVMQDNPDPDAIASSSALKELVNKTVNMSCQLAYGGTIGRAENHELVDYLGFNFHPFCEVDPGHFDLLALLDTQPGTGNNPLPAEFLPDIVIDHHPVRSVTRSVTFTDIRKNYGATSTILWEYLSAAKITPEIPIATALLYGIRSDTQDLGREATQADIEAMEALYPLANKRMLSQIQHGRVPSAYFQMLTTALTNTKIYEHCSICDIGEVNNADMIGEVADLLLRHEQVDWVLCYGFYDDRLLISLRTQDKEFQAGDIIRKIVHRIGTGGGHASMAGGQIPLQTEKELISERDRLERLICNRFLKALGVKNKRGKALVDTPPKTQINK